jgi:3-hydroxyacyl-CoA dehydrogenase/enoyl-CoA hydratase/3-hydroxybutyryl-CoA epimerase
MAHAGALFARQVERRRLPRAEAKRRLALVRPTLAYRGFARADLVIEAVVESLPVKQQVFAEVAAQVPPGAILASNTSSLPIDSIGGATPGRERVVGMHFFNPVDKMPLVEVVVGQATGEEAVATVWDFARRLGKTPVVVKSSPGFLVNRLLAFYSVEALWLLDEGHSIADIDRAMRDWGMPMGPLELTDEVGIDVAHKVAHILAEAFSDRLALPPWLDRVSGAGRLGAKSRSGFYRYDGRQRTEPDPEVYRLLDLAPRIENPDPLLLAERMVLPMVNEAARCLAEGVVRDAASLDLAMILGTGFPPFRGGLCRWADGQGIGSLVEALERFASTAGERHRPGEALTEVAAAGGFYARYPHG